MPAHSRGWKGASLCGPSPHSLTFVLSCHAGYIVYHSSSAGLLLMDVHIVCRARAPPLMNARDFSRIVSYPRVHWPPSYVHTVIAVPGHPRTRPAVCAHIRKCSYRVLTHLHAVTPTQSCLSPASLHCSWRRISTTNTFCLALGLTSLPMHSTVGKTGTSEDEPPPPEVSGMWLQAQ